MVTSRGGGTIGSPVESRSSNRSPRRPVSRYCLGRRSCPPATRPAVLPADDSAPTWVVLAWDATVADAAHDEFIAATACAGQRPIRRPEDKIPMVVL